MMNYKAALLAYKIVNDGYLKYDWLSFNFQKNFNKKNLKLNVYSTARFKIGKNISINRFSHVFNKIELNWLNLAINSFTNKCKTEFLEN